VIRFLEKLNLKPHEIRVVVAIGLVVFVFLNIWFVFPLFPQWAKTKKAIKFATQDYVTYQREIGRVPGPAGYEARLKKLEGDGAAILPEEYAVQLIRTIQAAASANGIVTQSIQTSGRGAATASPGDVFEEQSVNLTFNNADEKQLLDFMYELSNGKSLIRVRDMNVKPEATKTRLSGTLTLTASFQKNSLTKKSATTVANK
jgi:hypothetical protein